MEKHFLIALAIVIVIYQQQFIMKRERKYWFFPLKTHALGDVRQNLDLPFWNVFLDLKGIGNIGETF